MKNTSFKTFRKNGIVERIKLNGEARKVDKKRASIAAQMDVKYLGVKETIANIDKPSLQQKIVVEMPNKTILAMSLNTFLHKEEVNKNCKKFNVSENLVAEHLLKNGVKFFREVSINGYELSENFQQKKFTNDELNLLKKLEKAIADFIVFREDGPSLILSINGSFHHKQYDCLWKQFMTSGLAEKLGYQYQVVDTSEYKSVKNNKNAQMDLLEKVSQVLGIEAPTEEMKEEYETAITCKQVQSIFKGLKPEHQQELLKSLNGLA